MGGAGRPRRRVGRGAAVHTVAGQESRERKQGHTHECGTRQKRCGWFTSQSEAGWVSGWVGEVQGQVCWLRLRADWNGPTKRRAH